MKRMLNANVSGKRNVWGLIGRLLVVLMAVAMLSAACALGADQTVERSVSESLVAGAPAMDFDEAMEFASEEAFFEDEAMAFESEAVVTSDTAAQLPPGQDRLIIRTADMSIVVLDTTDSLARIAALAESNGGWVVSSGVFQSTETAKTGFITVRVPAEGFQSALDAISGMATEVESLSTSGDDVTEEFVDLESRLDNLEATADRVRGFMDETENVEEALAVNQELSRLEGEIEVIKGRMKYLSQSAAFSTISVNITPDELAQPVEIGGWQPQGVLRNAFEALISALQSLANFLIWFVVFLLPVLLIVAIPVALIIWLLRRWRQGRQEEVTSVEAEQVESDE